MSDDSYWPEYNNLQFTKHALIKNYLGGWFPKLGTWAGRILYLDTHAGRGRHDTGHQGSPLVALETLLTHRFRDQLLAKSEVRFHFIERNAANVAELKKELAGCSLPEKVFVQAHEGDCFATLDELIQELEATKTRMAPAFAFVDPYGFKVPGTTLKRLMQCGKVELFVNVIWRELNMGIVQAQNGHEGLGRTLDEVFAGEDWRAAVSADEAEARADQTIALLTRMVGAKWATPVRMLGRNGTTRYMLVHFSNHDAGRELMKYCVWKICDMNEELRFCAPYGSQQYLIKPQPDLSPIREWVLAQLPCTWKNLHVRCLREVWRDVHVNEVVKQLRKEGKVGIAPGYPGPFTIAANPLLAVLS